MATSPEASVAEGRRAVEASAPALNGIIVTPAMKEGQVSPLSVDKLNGSDSPTMNGHHEVGAIVDENDSGCNGDPLLEHFNSLAAAVSRRPFLQTRSSPPLILRHSVSSKRIDELPESFPVSSVDVSNKSTLSTSKPSLTLSQPNPTNSIERDETAANEQQMEREDSRSIPDFAKDEGKNEGSNEYEENEKETSVGFDRPTHQLNTSVEEIYDKPVDEILMRETNATSFDEDFKISHENSDVEESTEKKKSSAEEKLSLRDESFNDDYEQRSLDTNSGDENKNSPKKISKSPTPAESEAGKTPGGDAKRFSPKKGLADVVAQLTMKKGSPSLAKNGEEDEKKTKTEDESSKAKKKKSRKSLRDFPRKAKEDKDSTTEDKEKNLKVKGGSAGDRDASRSMPAKEFRSSEGLSSSSSSLPRIKSTSDSAQIGIQLLRTLGDVVRPKSASSAEAPSSSTAKSEEIEKQEESSTKVESLVETSTRTSTPFVDEWRRGDLVWCLQRGQPWWPCLVAPEHPSNRVSRPSSYKSAQYHVQFFGPKPLHAWVLSKDIKAFNHPDEVAEWRKAEESKAQRLTKRDREKLMKSYFPASKRLQEELVEAKEEVVRAAAMSLDERLRIFEYCYEPVNGVATAPANGIGDETFSSRIQFVPLKPSVAASRKRKTVHGAEMGADFDGFPPSSSATGARKNARRSSAPMRKIDKSDSMTPQNSCRRINSFTALESEFEEEKPQRHVHPNLQPRRAPPLSRSSFELFNLFCFTHRERVRSEFPNFDDQLIRKKLKEEWDSMSAEEIAKFAREASFTDLGKRRPSDVAAAAAIPPPSGVVMESPASFTSSSHKLSVDALKYATAAGVVLSPINGFHNLVRGCRKSSSSSPNASGSRDSSPSIVEGRRLEQRKRKKSSDPDDRKPSVDDGDSSPKLLYRLKSFQEVVVAKKSKISSSLAAQTSGGSSAEDSCASSTAGDVVVKRKWEIEKLSSTHRAPSGKVPTLPCLLCLKSEAACDEGGVAQPVVLCRGPCGGSFHRSCDERRKEKESKADDEEAKIKEQARVKVKSSTGVGDEKISEDGDSKEIKSEENPAMQLEEKPAPQAKKTQEDQKEKPAPSLVKKPDSDEDEKPAPQSPKRLDLKEKSAPQSPDKMTPESDEKSAPIVENQPSLLVAPCPDSLNFLCTDCRSGQHPCFACGRKDSSTKRCSSNGCGKYYHESCLRANSKFEELIDFVDGKKTFKCPQHACLECCIENPKSHRSKMGKMLRCVKCPAAYHVGDFCLPAGSEYIGGINIICAAHFEPVKGIKAHSHVNVAYCFACSKGGTLLCCESCPAAYHTECLEMKEEPQGDWFCGLCVVGKRPRYGEVVWVKLGSHRWWPAEICHPRNVPDNILERDHGVGLFPVRFLGSHDYNWLHAGRTFAYQDGDSCKKGCSSSKKVDVEYSKALDEAAEAYAAYKAVKAARDEKDSAHDKKRPAPYKFIRTNRPYGNVHPASIDYSELPVCECKPDQKDPLPCASNEDCLNRMLMYECHPLSCPAGDKCQNQRFQKRLYPKSVTFRTDNHRGWGLRALEDIKQGDFVNEYVGELIDDEEGKRRLEVYHARNETNFYMLTVDANRIIDAGPKGNYARFMNHSCDPNCETQKWTVNGATRVGLFARKDIAAGTELTFNYQLECKGDEKTTCHCGAATCSGFLGERAKTDAADSKKKKKNKTGEETEKETGAKKKKKKRKLKAIKVTDDWCFRCLEGGKLLLCDLKSCTKAYHLQCLERECLPYGQWSCPWHYCDLCTKQSSVLCALCPNSFCGEHAKDAGNIVEWRREGVMVCTEHEEEERGERRESLKKAEVERDQKFRDAASRRGRKRRADDADDGGAKEEEEASMSSAKRRKKEEPKISVSTTALESKAKKVEMRGGRRMKASQSAVPAVAKQPSAKRPTAKGRKAGGRKKSSGAEAGAAPSGNGSGKKSSRSSTRESNSSVKVLQLDYLNLEASENESLAGNDVDTEMPFVDLGATPTREEDSASS